MDIVSDRPSAVTVHAVILTDFRHSDETWGQYASFQQYWTMPCQKQTWNKQKPEWDTDARRQLLFACALPSCLPCFLPCDISNIDRVTANSRGNQYAKTEKKQSSKAMVSTIVQ